VAPPTERGAFVGNEAIAVDLARAIASPERALNVFAHRPAAQAQR
jgi:hypothetical protein